MATSSQAHRRRHRSLFKVRPHSFFFSRSCDLQKADEAQSDRQKPGSLNHVTVPNTWHTQTSGMKQTAQASSPSINNQELPDLHRRIRNRTHRPRVLINEAAAHTLFYTPVDTTPSDSILSLVARIKGKLSSHSNP